MHFLMFQMKRAHWSAVKAARGVCDEAGLTPARYDILHAALTFGNGTHQSAMTKMLGLSRTTVSKMIRRLIELGLLTRVRCTRDARTFLVTVTKLGLERMARVSRHIAKHDSFQVRFETAFDTVMSVVTAFAVQSLRWALRRCAVRCGDTAHEHFYTFREPDDDLDLDSED